MKNIDFEKLEIFTDIEHKHCVVQNVRKDLANMIYLNGNGIASHALAFKIYRNEKEYDDEECELLNQFVVKFGSPAFIDAIKKATSM